MKHNNYIYPDTDDVLTVKLINKIELNEGYWNRSEKHILNIVKKYIKRLNNNAVMLDAGCGIGRLIPIFEKHFSEIYAVEPDINRIENAEKMVKFHDLENKVRFINQPIEETCNKRKFDVIMCSHVIQHINNQTVEKIIQKFSESLCDEGLLFIMTCYSQREEDYFVQDYLFDLDFIEEEIKQERFEELVNNNVGILPVHFFTRNTIEKLLYKNKFEIIDFRRYHKNKDSKEFRDMLVVAKKFENS